MIIGSYKQLYLPREYRTEHWETALRWLADEGWKDMPPGKREIAGTDVYATRSLTRTKCFADTRYEVHRRYADIQLVLEGKELFMVNRREALRVTVPYDTEKDVEFLEDPGSGSPLDSHYILLQSAALAVALFPDDGHRPGIALGEEPAAVDKLVIKVRLS